MRDIERACKSYYWILKDLRKKRDKVRMKDREKNSNKIR